MGKKLWEMTENELYEMTRDWYEKQHNIRRVKARARRVEREVAAQKKLKQIDNNGQTVLQ